MDSLCMAPTYNHYVRLESSWTNATRRNCVPRQWTFSIFVNKKTNGGKWKSFETPNTPFTLIWHPLRRTGRHAIISHMWGLMCGRPHFITPFATESYPFESYVFLPTSFTPLACIWLWRNENKMSCSKISCCFPSFSPSLSLSSPSSLRIRYRL